VVKSKLHFEHRSPRIHQADTLIRKWRIVYNGRLDDEVAAADTGRCANGQEAFFI
jgi:hypothetical protein